MTAARGFARYLSGIDAGTEVSPLRAAAYQTLLGLLAARRPADRRGHQARPQ